MSPEPEESSPRPPIEDFVEGRTESLSDWRWLVEGDHRFPLRSHRPLWGRIVVFFKQLLRPLVRAPQSDLWDRQKAVNRVLLQQLENQLESLVDLRRRYEDLGQEVQQVQREILDDLRRFQDDYRRERAELSDRLEELRLEVLPDVVRHHDALFARLDQKLDRLRRERREPTEPAS